MTWLKNHLVWAVLFVLLVLGASLRFPRLGEIPRGYTYDEAGIVYDAWSIAIWHRDQFAHFMPLSFMSFGDFKPPLLIYILSFVYSIFGLHEIAIRYISAFAGLGSIVAIYGLTSTLFVDLKRKAPWVGLLAAFIVAVSPWSVQLSRVGFEQNLTFFIGLCGVWLLFKGIYQSKFWWISFPLLAASCYTFHTAKIFVPLVVFWTIWWYRKEFLAQKKSLIAPLLLGISLLLPLLFSSFFGQAGTRAKTIILYTDQGTPARIQQVIASFITNSINQLSPSFWINGWDGVSIRHAVPGFGVLLWPTYIIFLLSLVWLLIRRRGTRTWWLIGMVLIGLAPAILSRQTPHVIRSQFALIPVTLITSYGLFSGLSYIHKRFGTVILAITSIGLIISFTITLESYLFTYFGSYAKQSASAFQYGYKEAILYMNSIKRDNDAVLVTRSYQQPYIYLLLYNRIKAQDFLFGALNQYQIQDITWPDSRPHTLFIATPDEIPVDDPRVIKVITVPDTNNPVLVVAKNE